MLPPPAPADVSPDDAAAADDVDNSLELSFFRRPSSTLLSRGFTDADLLLGSWDDQPAVADATRSSITGAMADARTKEDGLAGDSNGAGPRGTTTGLELDLDGMLLEMAVFDEADDSHPGRSQPVASRPPPPSQQRRQTPSPPRLLARKTSLSSAPTSPRMGGIRWGSMSAAALGSSASSTSAASSSSEATLGPAFSLHSNRSTPIGGVPSPATRPPTATVAADGGNEGPRDQDSLTDEDGLEEGDARSTLTTTSDGSSTTTGATDSDALPPTPSSPTSSSHSSSHDGDALAFAFPLPPVAFGSSLDGSLIDLPSTPPPPRKAALPSAPRPLAPTEPTRILTIPIARKHSVNRSSPLSPAGAAARSTAAIAASSSASAPTSPRPDRSLAPNMRRTTSSNNHNQQYQTGSVSGGLLPPPSGLPPAPPQPTQPLTLPARTYHQKTAHSTSSTSSGPLSPLDGFGLVGASPVTSPTSSIATSSGSRGVRSPKSSKSAGAGSGGGGWSQLLSAFPRSSSKTSLGPSGQGSIRSARSDSSDRPGGLLSSFGSHRQSHASSSALPSSRPMGLSFSADAHLASAHPYAKRSPATPSGRLSDPPTSADSSSGSQRRGSNAQLYRAERNGSGAPQLALVVAEVDGDTNGYKCPVCVERIGAEYRIKGEKPDVIPECGHAIHHDCFVHVYGPLPERSRFGDVRKPQSFGVCGVCRKSMKVGESGAAGNVSSGKASKLAALTGMQSMSAPPPPLLLPSGGAGSGGASFLDDSDGDDNDPIDPLASGSSSTRSGQSDHVVRYEASGARIVVPSITVLPEYRNVVRGRPGTKTTVTAVVVFEVPERAPRDEQPEPSHGGRSLRGTRSEMSLRPTPTGLPGGPRGGDFGDPRADVSAISHTPVDILLILSLASPSTATSSTAFKTRVIRSSLAFVMSKMAARDRLSIVTYESGQDGVVRKTPFLAVGRDGDGRPKLLDLVANMGADDDRYVVPLHREERSDVVSAVNVALDVLLQRKTRNPISGVALVCDSADAVNRSQMDLVIARAEAAAVPIHSIGFGKAHDPSPLWLISNHTAGDYTFVPEWNDLQESLAGVIGGIMSIAMTQVKLHLSTQDPSFRFAKVCGPLNAIVPPDGKTIDIELRELCHGERKEILVEMELLAPGGFGGAQETKGGGGSDDDDDDDEIDSRAGDWASESGGGGGGRLGSVGMAKSASSRSSVGRSPARFRDSVAGDANHLRDAMFGANATIDEVPCLELDCSFFDPLCSKACTRLARPLLLQLTLLPHTTAPTGGAPETVVVRRRMELLASDMISRALIFISKTRRFEASLNLLEETRHVLQGKIGDLVELIGRESATGFGKSAKRAARDAVNRANLAALEAIMLDLGALVEGFDDDSWVDFNREQKNFGAQQAMILRSQRAWTARSEIERLYFTFENAVDLVHASSVAPRD